MEFPRIRIADETLQRGTLTHTDTYFCDPDKYDLYRKQLIFKRRFQVALKYVDQNVEK